MGSRKHLGKPTSQGKCNIWAAHKHLNDASSKGQAQHLDDASSQGQAHHLGSP